MIQDKGRLEKYAAFHFAGSRTSEVSRQEMETLNQKLLQNMLCIESFEQRQLEMQRRLESLGVASPPKSPEKDYADTAGL